jgi:hypothetical protein
MPRRALVIAVNGLARAVAVVSLAGAGVGCGGPRDTPSLRARDAHRKIPAIKQAVGEKDRDAIPHLVAGLENDDPAVRMYSIQGLRRLTGQTMGYRFYADDDARRDAVQRWKQWLAGQSGAAPAETVITERRDDDAGGGPPKGGGTSGGGPAASGAGGIE